MKKMKVYVIERFMGDAETDSMLAIIEKFKGGPEYQQMEEVLEAGRNKWLAINGKVSLAYLKKEFEKEVKNSPDNKLRIVEVEMIVPDDFNGIMSMNYEVVDVIMES